MWCTLLSHVSVVCSTQFIVRTLRREAGKAGYITSDHSTGVQWTCASCMREIIRTVTLGWHGPRPVLVPASLHHLPPSTHRQNQDEVEAVLGSLFVEDSVRINAEINWRESASSSSTNKWSNTCPSISFQQTCGRKSTTTTSTVTKAKSLTRTISWVNSTTHSKRYALISVKTPHWHWFLPLGLLLECPFDGWVFFCSFIFGREKSQTFQL